MGMICLIVMLWILVEQLNGDYIPVDSPQSDQQSSDDSDRERQLHPHACKHDDSVCGSGGRVGYPLTGRLFVRSLAKCPWARH